MYRSPLGATACAAVVLASTVSAGTLSVVATEPARYALGVPADGTTVRVTFDDVPVLSDPSHVRVAGNMSGLHTGVLAVDGSAIVFSPHSPFLPGELVSVNLHRDVGGTGGGTLTGGYYFAFTVASAAVVPDFTHRVGFGTSARPYFIHGGDVDGDGTPDVASPNEEDDSVSIFLNEGGTGDLSTHTEYGAGSVPSSIFGEDLDNDGDQDLATADISSSTMSVLLNDGTGAFKLAFSYPAGSITRQVHGGDFDGDNDVDICATSQGSGSVVLFWNQGDATFTPSTIAGVGSASFAIRTGDLNSDGHLDIAVANRNGNDLAVLMNDGAGSFTRLGPYLIGSWPWCLNGNDLDGDGDFDLVSVASQADQLIVLLNDGTGAFPTAVPYSTGDFPLGVFAADLDGDGDIDATSSNFGGASVDVFLNDGSGVMSLLDRLDLPLAGTYTWAHDLDGDGDLDLSTLDELADSLFVYTNGDEMVPVLDDDAPVSIPHAVSGSELRVWPNPFSAGATIQLELGGRESPTSVEIYAMDGRRVRSLGCGGLRNGHVELAWDGDDDAGRRVASGKYLLVARVDGAVVARAIAVIH